jgi:hypothetical protein
MREGVLRYDGDLDRWCFDDGEAYESLHCGEGIAVRIAGHFLWGRVEMDGKREWYCIFRGDDQTAFTFRKGSRYPARMRT